MTNEKNNLGHQNPAQATTRTAEKTTDIAALLGDLAANDITKRQNARTSLVAIGKPALPAMLEELAHAEFPVRWEIAKTLGEMRLPGSVPGLIEALEDDEQDVRWLAAVALANIGQAALAPLLEALISRVDSPYLRQGAHHVLTIFEDRNLEELLMDLRNALGPLKNEASIIPVAEKVLRALRS